MLKKSISEGSINQHTEPRRRVAVSFPGWKTAVGCESHSNIARQLARYGDKPKETPDE